MVCHSMTIRPVLGLFMVALMLGAADPGVALAGDTLRIGMAAEATTLDPHALNIAPNNAIGWHLFDALTHVDERTRLVPGLARSWHVVSPTEWEFRLRDDVQFHDGSAFEAADVIASIERVRRLPNGQFSSFVQRLIDVRAVDRHTIRIRTATPYALVPLDLNSVFIISHRHAEAPSANFDQGSAAVGTGPWRLTRFERGERVLLDRNEHYWGEQAHWPRAEMRMISGEQARVAALLGGDLDMIEAVPGSAVVRLRNDARFTLAQTVSWRTLFFHLDQRAQVPALIRRTDGSRMAVNPLTDRRVRLALAAAIDREAIIDKLLDGTARPASNLVAPGVFGHDDSLAVPRFDPAAARRLLADAGYRAGFNLTVAAPNNRYPADARIAQAVAAMFSRIGVRTEVASMPINVYLGRARRGEFAVALLGWGSFSGDLALRSLLATRDPSRGNGTWNWSYYHSADLDAMIERAFAELDPDRRAAQVRAAMHLAMTDQAVIPLHHQNALWALRAGLRYRARTDEFTFAHHVTD